MSYFPKGWYRSDDRPGCLERHTFCETDTLEDAIKVILDLYTGDEFKLYVTNKHGRIVRDLTKELLE